MAKIKIQITSELIEQELRSGNTIRDKCLITKGLPADAKLVDAYLITTINVLELVFETKESDYVDGEIITPKFTKYIEDEWK